MAGYGDSAFFGLVNILPVTANRASESPTVSFDFLDNITDLQVCSGQSVFDHLLKSASIPSRCKALLPAVLSDSQVIANPTGIFKFVGSS